MIHPVHTQGVYRQIQTVEKSGRGAKHHQDVHVGAAVLQRFIGADIELPADDELHRRSQHQLEPRIHQQIGRPDPVREGEMARHRPEQRK
ncbi:hypothetical protein D3C74_437750 [compost metagenome]